MCFAEREEKGVPGDSGEGREGAGADDGQFGAWNVESYSVGGGTESVGKGVELKAVGQVGRSTVVDAVNIAKGSDLLWDSF